MLPTISTTDNFQSLNSRQANKSRVGCFGYMPLGMFNILINYNRQFL